MSFARWFRPPRHILAVFVGIVCVLAGALGWLGGQLLGHNQSLESQRVQERLEKAADEMAAALAKNLVDLDSRLSSGASEPPPEGVLLLSATGSSVEARPSGRLLYYPALDPQEAANAGVFANGEKLEFQANHPAEAAEMFRELAKSPDLAIRAGALLRLGRNLRKLGRNEEALRVFGELAALPAVSIDGLPAEVISHQARCRVLESMGNREELRKAAAAMQAGLLSGRWRLLRPAWEFHREETLRWTGADARTARERDGEALSIGAEWVYRQWLPGSEQKGRRILSLAEGPALATWTAEPRGLRALVAGPAYLSRIWSNSDRGVRGALVDRDDKVVLGSMDRNARQAVRTTFATSLPWTLHATLADPGADLANFATRRRVLLWGFAVVALVLAAGSYFILRSVAREHAVAKLQSEFVSAVSHEFRTPLTSLRQLSELLASGRVAGEEMKQQSYEILVRESERLQRLVESLLDFGRMEAQAVRYRFEDVDPEALLSGVAAEFGRQPAAAGYHVEFTQAGAFPPIRADREALGLAIWNLLDNAVKYSPHCQTVWVGMARERNCLAISVRDRGMGIPPREQKEIFKRFVRGTASQRAHIKGTGIGLSMARHIVEAHGGEIRLESEPGKGSTFTVLLPMENTE